MLAALAQAGLHPAEPLPGKWVVDCKRVGNGEKALVYLGRYLYRGVIREADLLACDHDGSGQVSFRYRDSQSGESKVRTLPGAEFLHLLLQHVLPKGFRRARNYGFLHPNKKGLIALLHLVLRIVPRPPTPHKPRPPEFDSYARKYLFLLERTFKNATTTAPTAPAPLVFLSLRHEAPGSAPC